MSQISELIDKQNTFEIIRDKIAQILANEIANQKTIATNEGKDPSLWDLEVYTERSNPWEKWLNQSTNKVPIVNVWFDNYNLDGTAGNTVEYQTVNGIFNIDVYGFDISRDNQAGGHLAGDELSAKETQRAYRLVRNILMSSFYTYLDLRPIVSQRWIQSATAFQPEQQGGQVQQVQAIRMAFAVKFLEFSPQYQGEGIEYISNDIKRTEDGAVIAEADYQYPLN